MRKRRPARLNQASAYFRLAAKADRAGQYAQGKVYRATAERLVRMNQAEQEYRNRIQQGLK